MRKIKEILCMTMICVMLAQTLFVTSVSAAESKITISGETRPSSIKKGNVFYCEGKSSSNNNLRIVTAGLYSSDMGKAYYTKSVSPNKTTCDLSGDIDKAMYFNRLDVGEYRYVVYAEDTAGYGATLIDSRFSVTTDSTLKITNMTKPSSIKKGKVFACKGTVSSNYNITSVTGGIYSTNYKKTYYSKTIKPNAKSAKISGAIDNAMLFNKLGEGTYNYRVQAKDSSGNMVTEACTFTVGNPKKAASTLKISGASQPDSIKKGKAFACKGTISSNYKLTKVTGTITKEGASKAKYSKSVNPKVKSYKLNGSAIDNAMLFNKLAAGTYYYKVTAKDESGASKTLINKKFKVTESTTKAQPVAKKTKKADTGSQKTEKINLKPYMSKKAMKQSTYDDVFYIKEEGNVGCLSTSYAIGLSIVTKKKCNPTKYWDGNRANDMNKLKEKEKYNTVLIYNNLKKNLPVLVHYKYKTGGGHWVVVTGVKAGKQSNKLSYKDLYIYDPVSGTKKTLNKAYNFYGSGVDIMRRFTK